MNLRRISGNPQSFSVTCGVMVLLGAGLPVPCAPDRPAATAAADAVEQEQFEPLFPVRKDGKWGYINRQGKIVIEPAYTDASEFHDGRALVQVGEKWGYVDHGGKLAFLPQKYAPAGEFSEGLAAVTQPHGLGWPMRVGYFDTTGKLVIEPKHYGEYSQTDFRDGRALVRLTGMRFRLNPLRLIRRYGYIDESGEFAITPQFDEAKPFSDGLAKVWKDDKATYIDTAGKTVIDVTQYHYTGDFSEGLAFVAEPVERGGKIGYIDRKGKTAIRPQFDSAGGFHHGLARVTLGDRWEEYDTPGGKGKRLVHGKLGYINTSGDYVWGPTQ